MKFLGFHIRLTHGAVFFHLRSAALEGRDRRHIPVTLPSRLRPVRRQGGPCRPPAASEVRSRPAVPNRAVCRRLGRFSPVLVTWVTFTSFVSAITCSRSRKHNTRLGNLLRITCTTGEVTCFAKSFTLSPWVEFLRRCIRSSPIRSLQPWPNIPRLLRLLRRRLRRRLPPCRRHRRRPRQRGTSPKRMLLSDLAGVRKEHGHEPSCSGLCIAVSVACRDSSRRYSRQSRQL
jgi:hypothetical protein